MTSARILPILALLLAAAPLSTACAGGGDPPPAPAPAAEGSSAEEEALRRADEAAERARRLRLEATSADREAEAAQREALRARRRDLEARIRTTEDALDAVRAKGDAAEVVSNAEARLLALYAESAEISARLAGGRARAAARPAGGGAGAVVPAGRAPVADVPFAADTGLAPITPRESTDDAVADGLDWLARHRSPDGRWDCDGFDARCEGARCPGAGGPLHDVGVTGLATLAFLGAGETHKTPRHGAVVRDALKYLKSSQDPEGCFGPRTSNHFVYDHAAAALAMAEAYALTQSPLFKDAAQAGVDFIHRAQNPYAGWRYGVRPGDSDTSVTGWMVMALKSARVAGLRVEDAAFQGARAWLDRVTDPETGRVGYTMRGNGPARPTDVIDRYPTHLGEALTAEGVLARILCGDDKNQPLVRKGIDICVRRLPSWDGDAGGGRDFVYWYFGTMATFQAGGDAWRTWREAANREWFRMQRGEADGCARGSWDPSDPWGAEGGRVYSTALTTMAASALSRYNRAAWDGK